jgi:tetratricopeptide (TPR) repeat protein
MRTPQTHTRSAKTWNTTRLALALLALSGVGAGAGKDLGPAGMCDVHDKGSPAWSGCVGKSVSGLSDEELFYAGYWMARLERYDEAKAYLRQVSAPDVRTLTYLGFATRKSGDVAGAFPLYRRALDINPDFVVARAYLGEALLSIGDHAGARAELSEIALRCGATCAAHAELARHIALYEGQRG